MECLVSVIVPVYNVSKYLNRCVDSILNQTYRNLEVILVNDGSKDDSGAICEQYTKKDKRVRVIHKKNEGLGFARNSGLDIANGEYVTFIDGDDYIGDTRIEYMLATMNNCGADTCMTGFTKEITREKKIQYPHVNYGNNYSHSSVMKNILPKMCGADESGHDYIEMSVCMVIFSNKIIQENMLRFVSERELISEDLVFDFEYYPLANKVCITDTCDYYYCDNENSLTTKYRPDRFNAQTILYKTILEKAKSLGIYSECKPRCQNTLIAIARYSIKLEEKFKRVNGLLTARKNIKNICNSEILQRSLFEIDITKVKKTSRIVNYMMMRKMILALIVVMRIKNIFNI